MSLREDNVRVSLGDLFHDQWDSTETAGYDPNLAESNADHLDIHLGHHDADRGYPQLSLRDVPTTAVSRAWKADGSGLTTRYTGRIDATVWVGSEDDVDENAQLLCETIGWHVHDIVHDFDRLTDPATGALLTEGLGPQSEPNVQIDTDGSQPRYYARVEVGYRRGRQPP